MCSAQSTPKSSSTSTKSRLKPGAACEECRRRKLRCDRKQPQCCLCKTAGIECQVTTSRPPRGPKRGYLKALLDRISELSPPAHLPSWSCSHCIHLPGALEENLRDQGTQQERQPSLSPISYGNDPIFPLDMNPTESPVEIAYYDANNLPWDFQTPEANGQPVQPQPVLGPGIETLHDSSASSIYYDPSIRASISSSPSNTVFGQSCGGTLMPDSIAMGGGLNTTGPSDSLDFLESIPDFMRMDL